MRAVFAKSEFADAARAAATRIGAEIEVLRVDPILDAFEPFLASQAYDVCELSIVNVLQAVSLELPMVILPVTTMARTQHQTLVTLKGLTMSDAEEHSIGVRQWSQTTGVWMRGFMAEDYQVNLRNIDWLAYENGYVAELPDPDWIPRARDGGDIIDDFLSGRLDFIIMGGQLPGDERIRTVLDDPGAAGEEWSERHGYLPINHVVAVTTDAAKGHADELCAIYDALAERASTIAGRRDPVDRLPVGFSSLRAPITKAMEYAYEQGILPHRIEFDQIVTASCDALQIEPSRFEMAESV